MIFLHQTRWIPEIKDSWFAPIFFFDIIINWPWYIYFEGCLTITLLHSSCQSGICSSSPWAHPHASTPADWNQYPCLINQATWKDIFSLHHGISSGKLSLRNVGGRCPIHSTYQFTIDVRIYQTVDWIHCKRKNQIYRYNLPELPRGQRKQSFFGNLRLTPSVFHTKFFKWACWRWLRLFSSIIFSVGSSPQ